MKFGQKGAAPVLILIAVVGLIGFLVVASTASFKNNLLSNLFFKPFSKAAGNVVSNITDNRADYPNSQIPKFEKFEATFNVETNAQNPQMPFDPSPPPGVQPNMGVTVNGEFSQDNFVTKSVIPAFYYQDFDYQVKGTKDWIYPKDSYFWKLRFAPDKEGAWQYRITTQDSSGSSTSAVQTFNVVANAANHGFIKVSKTDSRYFEYEDGIYFPGLGYNMNYNGINWNSPVQSNKANFQVMGQNGIQLIRHWISQWGIFSSIDTTWESFRLGADDSATRIPFYNGNVALPPSVKKGVDGSMMMQQYWQPCILNSSQKETPAVKPNTKYKIFVRYLTPTAFPSPTDSTKPQGLVVKTGNWLSATNNPCNLGVGTALTSYGNKVSTKDTGGNWQWNLLEGEITTKSTATNLDILWLYLENMDHTSSANGAFRLFIDRVEVREDTTGNCAIASGQGADSDLSNGQCGVDILSRPDMDYLKEYDQKFSYSFDKVLELAHQNNVYLKLDGMEKNEYLMNHIDFSGLPILDNQPNNLQPDGRIATPGAQIDDKWYYGNWRSMTKVRWLQQAWWRYMQARWGYSTNIHSWELNNEGDPYNGTHWTLADEFAKYMHQFGVNSHLVTTSNWNSYPLNINGVGWNNPAYQNLDYTDVHQYMCKTGDKSLRFDNNYVPLYRAPDDYYDTANLVDKLSLLIGAKQPTYGLGKPVMRGETGLLGPDCTASTTELANDTLGIWLHKFIWAGMNSGGVIDASYWWSALQIYPTNKPDLRVEFGKYYNFIKDIPLSNGNYKEASASTTNTNIRVMGQKDIVNKRAHIWIDNKTNTWGNVVYATPSATIAAGTSITIPNMPQGSYPVKWIDTYAFATASAALVKSETVSVGSDGNLNLSLPQILSTDIAVKIGDYSTVITPSPSPSQKPGDLNGNGRVDIFDYNTLLFNFGKSGVGIAGGDLDGSGRVGIQDFNILLFNFGK